MIEQINQHVYVILDDRGWTKIGVSTNPALRCRQIGVITGTNPILVSTHNCSKFGYKVEALLHKHYTEKHIQGEWYDLSEFDRDFVPYLVSTFLHGCKKADMCLVQQQESKLNEMENLFGVRPKHSVDARKNQLATLLEQAKKEGKRLTRLQLAQIVGVSESTIKRWKHELTKTG